MNMWGKRRAGRPRVNHLEEAEIIRLRLTGMAPREIAKKTQRSLTTVYKALRTLPKDSLDINTTRGMTSTPRSE